MTPSRRISPRRSAQAWQALLDEQRMSGLTVTAFCRQVSISPASFYRWQGRLQPQGGSSRVPTVSDADADAMPAMTVRKAPTSSHPDFVDLGALADLTPTRREDVATPRVELRLDLGAGLVLHLVRG